MKFIFAPLAVAVIGLSGCFASSKDLSEIKRLQDLPRHAVLETPKGETLRTRLALTDRETTQGLSGVRPSDFGDDEAMLFIYPTVDTRYFWMPDTYFDLDIFFLDKELRIVEVARDMKHHPGRNTPPPIARTPRVTAWAVIELKASSKISKGLKLGDRFTWQEPETWETFFKLVRTLPRR